MQPLVQRCAVPKSVQDFTTLGGAFPRKVEIVAYTCFGDLFLHDVASSSIAIAFLTPFELVPLDASSIDEAVALLEDNAEAKQELLKPTMVEELVRKLGPLGDSEIFVPYPLPMWGGDGSLASYQKGNVWAHVEMVTA